MTVQFHPKVTAGTFAAALTVIIISEAQRRGYVIDGTEGASITTILSLAAGYFMPSDDPAPVQVPVPPVNPPVVGA